MTETPPLFARAQHGLHELKMEEKSAMASTYHRHCGQASFWIRGQPAETWLGGSACPGGPSGDCGGDGAACGGMTRLVALGLVTCLGGMVDRHHAEDAPRDRS